MIVGMDIRGEVGGNELCRSKCLGERDVSLFFFLVDVSSSGLIANVGCQ